MRTPSFKKSRLGGTVLSLGESPRRSQKAVKAKKPVKDPRPKTTAGNGTVIQSWASDAGRFLVYGLALLVALAALCGFLAFNRPVAQAQQVVEPGINAQQQKAGAFAQSYLAAWLSATGTDHKELDRYFKSSLISFGGTVPTEYRDMTVASIEEAPGNLTTVIVSTTLKNTLVDADGKESTAWTPYWYQVVVSNKGENLATAGLPSPVSSPSIGEALVTGYPSRVSNKEIQATVTDFMNSYLTGQGDVMRFISPDADIHAVSPAYWKQTKVKTVQSAEDVSDKAPEVGQTAQILVDVDLINGENTKPAQYVMSLKVRDGRWEIQSLDSAPKLSK